MHSDCQLSFSFRQVLQPNNNEVLEGFISCSFSQLDDDSDQQNLGSYEKPDINAYSHLSSLVRRNKFHVRFRKRGFHNIDSSNPPS